MINCFIYILIKEIITEKLKFFKIGLTRKDLQPEIEIIGENENFKNKKWLLLGVF